MSLPKQIEELRARRTLRIVKGNRRYEVASDDGQRALLSSAKRIVLIVHGFNNTEAAAKNSYEALYEQLFGILPETFLENVWEVFWPGYWPWVLKHQLISWTSYSWKAFQAERIGVALAECLETLAGEGDEPKEVLFVAHSLGCRVVLESILHFRANRRCSTPGMCLMAAAVPTFMLRPDGRLKPAADDVEKHYILHSRADHTLRLAFPPGQLPVDGRLSEAVGRFGNPTSCWRNDYGNVVNTDLDHGEYYTGLKGSETFVQSRTAPTIGRMLGRSLPRYLPEADPYVVNWKVRSAQAIQEHNVPVTRWGQ